jgi:multidrug efflux pump subunit AcrA (membrane-fusion protein)
MSNMRKRMTLPRSRRTLVLLGAVVLGLLILVRLSLTLVRPGALATTQDSPTSTPTLVGVPPPVLAAHGLVQPVARASVATLAGGTVAQLNASVGQEVEPDQVLARVVGPAQTELVLAPWRGTVTSLAARTGDTLPPGAPLLTIADPSRLQVETTDVDDYLIGRIRPRQLATITFYALDGRSLRGTVRSISAQSQPAPGGGVQYPTVIELSGAAPDLRPGMSAHIVFEE